MQHALKNMSKSALNAKFDTYYTLVYNWNMEELKGAIN